jgi:outer membrane protein OmpA-like peptidoglycan-associated protein
MPLLRFLACALGALVAGCGGGDSRALRTTTPASADSPAAAASSEGAAVTGTSAAAAGSAARDAFRASADWVDPEPPGAQVLAESVRYDRSNADKTTSLRMIMTTIVGQTTTLAGSATALAARESSVEDRLSRLGAEVSGTEITIRLPGSILFDFDSADLRADAERTLEEVAAVLVAYAPRPVRVEGHTDSIASDAYNQGLSERRAASVVRWLGAHGVAGGRMKSAGRGETRPVADNGSVAGRQQNRRVELVIEKGTKDAEGG